MLGKRSIKCETWVFSLIALFGFVRGLRSLPRYRRMDTKKQDIQLYTPLAEGDDGGYFILPTVPQVEMFEENDSFPDEDDDGSFDSMKQRMRRQLIGALDHLPEREVDAIMNMLWTTKDGSVLQIRLKLTELTRVAESIEAAAVRRQRSYNDSNEDLADEIRVVRSQIRMYCDDRDIRLKNKNKNNNNNINNRNGGDDTAETGGGMKFRKLREMLSFIVDSVKRK